MRRITTHSPGGTAAVGRAFAAELAPGDVVALSGTLGSGKTQFVCGLCEGIGVSGRVSSPTFTMINEYPAPFGKVVHVDLYRIRSESELAELGIEEYFNDRCITCIEWPEAMAAHLPSGVIRVTMEHGSGETERTITIARGGQ